MLKYRFSAANISCFFEKPKFIIPFFHFIPSNNAFLSFSLPMIAKKSLSLQQKITFKYVNKINDNYMRFFLTQIIMN